MPYIDMTKSGRDLKPGVDLWRVEQCVARPSRNGDQMFEMKLARASNDQDTILDWIMLEGGGWEIGKEKLRAYGIGPDFKGELDALSFVGKRVWAATAISPYTDKEGKQRESLKVDINELKFNGLQPENDVPPGCSAPAAEVDDTPF